MVDLDDERRGGETPQGAPVRRRSVVAVSGRRTRAAPVGGTTGGEDLSGGIPRSARPIVTSVTGAGRLPDDEPALPSWVKSGSRAQTVPPGAPAVEALSGAHRAPPEPVVVVPAVQPDEPAAPVEAEPSDQQGARTPRRVGWQLQLPRRARVRRVTRVVRYVDPWGVFKVALLFNLVGYATTLVAGVLLWNVAHATGTVDNVERFMESFGWETFEFRGGEIFHNAWIIGLFVVVGLTGLAVLAAATFNLVTDLVGGVRVTVLEEELVAAPARPWVRSASLPASDARPAAVDAGAEPAAEASVDPWSRPGAERG